MKKIILPVLFLALVGCSDKDNAPKASLNSSANDGYAVYEKEYMNGCTKGRDNQAFCQCTFDQIKKQISLDEIKRIDRGSASQQDKEKFTKVIFQGMVECQSSY